MTGLRMSTMCGGCGENQELLTMAGAFVDHVNSRTGEPCPGDEITPAPLAGLNDAVEVARVTMARMAQMLRLLPMIGQKVWAGSVTTEPGGMLVQIHGHLKRIEVMIESVDGVIYSSARIYRIPADQIRLAPTVQKGPSL